MSVLKKKIVKVDTLSRIEGEGSLYIRMKGTSIRDLKLKLFEPPRFCETFLRGRRYGETADVLAQAFTVCPVASQISAINAIESLYEVEVDESVFLLRKIALLSEWLDSHMLHIYLLQSPDFLGYQSAIHVAADFPDLIERGLNLKRIGRDLLELAGGRPSNHTAGGCTNFPALTDLTGYLPKLQWAKEACNRTIEWVSGFDFPSFEVDYTFVCLGAVNEYPISGKRLVSNRGLDIAISDFDRHFEEVIDADGNTFYALSGDHQSYMVGPLARINVHFDKLLPEVKQKAAEVGFSVPCLNPFFCIVARSLECYEAILQIEDALRRIQRPSSFLKSIVVKEGTGFGCTEAPRGICYQKCNLDDAGTILDARIITPTAQNQLQIENDLRAYVEALADQPREKLAILCEQAIRNYNPSTSCTANWLGLHDEVIP